MYIVSCRNPHLISPAFLGIRGASGGTVGQKGQAVLSRGSVVGKDPRGELSPSPPPAKREACHIRSLLMHNKLNGLRQTAFLVFFGFVLFVLLFGL